MFGKLTAAGVSIAVGYWGLRNLWKYQHRLNVPGYILQAVLVVAGMSLIMLGVWLPNSSVVGRASSILGVAFVFAFLLFPDLIYYSLKGWNKLGRGRGDNQNVS